MIQMLNKRRNRAEDSGEEGFTLIELMVVVLIIGILIAIAVPTFLGAQKRAKDRAAQSNVRQALSSGKTMYTDKSTYEPTSGVISELKAIEPGLGFTATTSTKVSEVGVVSDPDQIGYVVLSKNGNCFYIWDDVSDTADAGTWFFKDGGGAATTCTATVAKKAGAGRSAEDGGW